jgi:hypothetical protein
MTYYNPDIFGHTDAPSGYGVSPDYSGQIDPLSFLESYLKRGLGARRGIETPREQEYFEYRMNQPRPEGTIRLDPNKLDLNEFRDPNLPSDPGEFLERDRFLLGPRSPLAQLAPRMVRNVYAGYQGDPYVITPEDKLNMMMDYRDVLEHDRGTLRSVFGPLQAP